MYEKKIKIFIVLGLIALSVCIAGLINLQLLSGSYYLTKIEDMKEQKGYSKQFKTLRGKILDRKGRIIAEDRLRFQVQINYSLTRYWDERIQRAELLTASLAKKPDEAISGTSEKIENSIRDLQHVIDKCAQFGMSRADIENKIRTINDQVWNTSTIIAWVRNYSNPDILKTYNNDPESIPLSAIFADFRQKEPNENKRLLAIVKAADTADSQKDWPLMDLKTDEELFSAQLEFMDITGVNVKAELYRFYPFNSAACQTIGWVAPIQNDDKNLFGDDPLLKYQDSDFCGKEDGIEYVCEPILRGKRGRVIYDIDKKLVNQTDTQFGKDVRLTLDIELQQKIEQYFLNPEFNPNHKSPCAAAVLDIATGEILALVSTPVFDLNRIRYDYGKFAPDPCGPLKNRAINEQYPPGSVIKPLILIAGLETNKIGANEPISCPGHAPPKGWPQCWIQKKNSWQGHDDLWGQGQNIGRNALKGSCNAYFSHLADRIEPLSLQKFLFNFGYGREILFCADETEKKELERNLRQPCGAISNVNTRVTITDFNQIPPLNPSERRWFGIGQGSLRVTPLQVAGAMASIARGGIFKTPCLIDNSNKSASVSLNISPQTLYVVRDGMSAVVNETGGTAYEQFAYSNFTAQGVKVYGKTGSTERPFHAWFAGFAENGTGHGIALAVIVEGGQHGATDAGPLTKEIIQFCLDAGYIVPR